MRPPHRAFASQTGSMASSNECLASQPQAMMSSITSLTFPQASVLKDAGHHLAQPGETDRLDEKLDGAAAHGGNDGRHVVEGGHENDVDLGGALTQHVQEREPADIGHAHIGEHHIRFRVVEHGERAGAVFRDADGDPVIGQRLGQRSADDGIVVDDEDAPGHGLRLEL